MNHLPPSSGPAKEVIAPRHESLSKEFNGQLGPQPLEYGETRLWLVARDPATLFAYWEFDPAEHAAPRDAAGQPQFFLRVLDVKGRIESEVPVTGGSGNIFVPAKCADSSYAAELGFYASGVWGFMARSGPAFTPPSGPPPPVANERADAPSAHPARRPPRPLPVTLVEELLQPAPSSR